jgi:hypothetical protein
VKVETALIHSLIIMGSNVTALMCASGHMQASVGS